MYMPAYSKNAWFFSDAMVPGCKWVPVLVGYGDLVVLVLV